MRIYFSCSITGGRQDQSHYQTIVRLLQDQGHDVLTAHLASPDILDIESMASPGEVYQRDIGWIDACDLLIAEVSTPSHGVGYELAYAVGIHKPVLCCYQDGQRVSKMITGNPHLQAAPYQDMQDLFALISRFLESNASLS